jgi:hypothetical protein
MREESEDTIRNVMSRLSALEGHMINLIIPIQHICEIFKEPGAINALKDLTKTPILIDDRSFKETCREVMSYLKKFEEVAEKIFSYTFPLESKFIAKRLHEIERDLKEILKSGVQGEVCVSLSVDGVKIDEDHPFTNREVTKRKIKGRRNVK